jgi:hypothetical protein
MILLIPCSCVRPARSVLLGPVLLGSVLLGSVLLGQFW